MLSRIYVRTIIDTENNTLERTLYFIQTPFNSTPLSHRNTPIHMYKTAAVYLLYIVSDIYNCSLVLSKLIMPVLTQLRNIMPVIVDIEKRICL